MCGRQEFWSAGQYFAGFFDSLLGQLSYLIEKHISDFGLSYEKNKNPLIKRIFLTSSRKYKKVRITDANSIETKKFYSEMLMPKFIWVCEVAIYTNYRQRKMFGEIVLDATASRYEHINSTILIRIGDIVGYRRPDESIFTLIERLGYRTKRFDIEFSLL